MAENEGHSQIVRELTGIGKTMVYSDSDTNHCIILGVFKLDKPIIKDTFINRINNSLCLYWRFKSVLMDTTHFKIIPDFDARGCISLQTVNENIIKQFGFNDINQDSIKSIIYQLSKAFVNKPFSRSDTLPLWRMHLYNFTLPSNNFSVIIFRAHHCILDGFTFGILWFKFVCDKSDDTHKKPEALKQPKISKKNIKTRNCFYIILKYIGYILFYIFGFFGILYKLFPFIMYTEPKNIFKPKVLSHEKDIWWESQISLSKINKIRKQLTYLKPTFNDFMVTILVHSLSLYMTNLNINPPEYLYMGVPVNIRTTMIDDNILKSKTLGNKIGTILIKAPLSKKLSFNERLQDIKNQFDFAKKIPEAQVSHYIGKLLSYFPDNIYNIIASGAFDKITFNISNNRCDNNARYINNIKMDNILPFPPSPKGVGLTFGISTYNDTVSITINNDINITEKNVSKNIAKIMMNVLRDLDCL